MITPDTFAAGSLALLALGVMFGMGLTLWSPDFGLIAQGPLPVLVGCCRPARDHAPRRLGPVLRSLSARRRGRRHLVGRAPGGTASNVTSLPGKGTSPYRSPYSISMLLAILMTPLLTAWLVGNVHAG